MKFPLTLSLMATALGSTVFFGESAIALPTSTPLQIALSDAKATETPMVFVENGVGGASVLWRVSGDDEVVLLERQEPPAKLHQPLFAIRLLVTS